MFLIFFSALNLVNDLSHPYLKVYVNKSNEKYPSFFPSGIEIFQCNQKHNLHCLCTLCRHPLLYAELTNVTYYQGRKRDSSTSERMSSGAYHLRALTTLTSAHPLPLPLSDHLPCTIKRNGVREGRGIALQIFLKAILLSAFIIK